MELSASYSISMNKIYEIGFLEKGILEIKANFQHK